MDEIINREAAEGGKFRGFAVTVNNPTVECAAFLDAFSDEFRGTVRHAVWQLEVGENGTPHFQAAIYFKNKRKWTVVKEAIQAVYPGAHVEVARNYARLSAYCRKDETRQEGPHEYGSAPCQGRRTDLVEAIECVQDNIGKKRPLQEVARLFPNTFAKFHRGIIATVNAAMEPRSATAEMVIECFWGPTGTGKSHKAKTENPDAFRWTPMLSANNSIWFGSYMGHKTVIMEEFSGQLQFKALLCLLENGDLEVPIKGGFSEMVATKFVFTSSKHPRDWYPNLATAEGDIDQLVRRFTRIVHFSLPFGGAPRGN